MKLSSVLLVSLLAACVVSTSVNVAKKSLAEVKTYNGVKAVNTLRVGNTHTIRGSASIDEQPPVAITPVPEAQPLDPANPGPLVISPEPVPQPLDPATPGPLVISPAPQPLDPANSGPEVISAPTKAKPYISPRKVISARPKPQAPEAPPKVITTSKTSTVGNRFGYPRTTFTTTTTKQVYPGGRGVKTTTSFSKSYTDKQYIVNGQQKDPKNVDLQLEKEWSSLKEDMERFDREMNSRMRKLQERVMHLKPRSQKAIYTRL